MESVIRIFEGYLTLSLGQADDTLYTIRQEFPDDKIVDFVDHLARRIALMAVPDLRMQQKAGMLCRSLLKEDVISKDLMLTTLSNGIITELPSFHSKGQKIMPNFVPFLVEVFFEEANLNWMVAIGEIVVTEKGMNRTFWDEFCCHVLLKLKDESSEGTVKQLVASTKDLNGLISNKDISWLSDIVNDSLSPSLNGRSEELDGCGDSKMELQLENSPATDAAPIMNNSGDSLNLSSHTRNNSDLTAATSISTSDNEAYEKIVSSIGKLSVGLDKKVNIEESKPEKDTAEEVKQSGGSENADFTATEVEAKSSNLDVAPELSSVEQNSEKESKILKPEVEGMNCGTLETNDTTRCEVTLDSEILAKLQKTADEMESLFRDPDALRNVEDQAADGYETAEEDTSSPILNCITLNDLIKDEKVSEEKETKEPEVTQVVLEQQEVKANDVKPVAETKAKDEDVTILDIKIPSSLSDYRCHFTWAAEAKDGPLTEEEVKTIEKVLTDKFDSRDLDTESTALSFDGMKIIADKATQAFCNIALNKPEDGEIQISEATMFIDKCSENKFFPEEYAQGLRYVVRGLLLFYLCHKVERREDEEAKGQLDIMIPSSVPFHSLSIKSQVAVKIMEHYFGVHRRDQGVQKVQLLKEIISQDTYFTWYYELYTLLRVRRREGQFSPGLHTGPDEEEKAMIVKAMELSPDNPFVIIGLCRCLLEIFSAKYKTDFETEPSNSPIVLGSFGTFSMSKEIVDFTRKMARKVLELHGGSTRINISLSEFFSVLLPYQLRDNSFAKECIERALKDNPKSSKSNHRMAAFLLTAERKPAEALKYFKVAVENDARNYPALSDMIQTYMGFSGVQQYTEELEELFQTHLENPRWIGKDQGNLYFLFGILMHMKKDTNAAINSWIKAYTCSPDSVKTMKSISYSYRRHNWNPRAVSIQDVHSVLKKASTDAARGSSETEILKQILDIADGIALADRERNSGSGSRGRGRGRGSGGGRGRGDSQHQGGGRGGSNSGRGDNRDWRSGRGNSRGSGRGGSNGRGGGDSSDSIFRGRGGSNSRGGGDSSDSIFRGRGQARR